MSSQRRPERERRLCCLFGRELSFGREQLDLVMGDLPCKVSNCRNLLEVFREVSCSLASSNIRCKFVCFHWHLFFIHVLNERMGIIVLLEGRLHLCRRDGWLHFWTHFFIVIHWSTARRSSSLFAVLALVEKWFNYATRINFWAVKDKIRHGTKAHS